jgi:hypothetical protein
MEPVETAKRTSKPYDVIKQFVEIILPASAVAYAGIASIWDLPNPEKVLATIAVAATFLGVCLKISRKQYYGNELNFDGQMVVTETPEGGKLVSLDVHGDPQETIVNAIESGKKTVEFKVVTAPPDAVAV